LNSLPIQTSDLGVGIGLRNTHYSHILDKRPEVPWFEVISENFMGLRTGSGGRPFEILEQVRKNYPIMLHGVSLSIGSTDPLNLDYLRRLKDLAVKTQPIFVSDHLCWTGVGGENLHDLLPLPYNEEALRHVVNRVKQVQDLLGRRILLENVSSYVTYTHSEMTEWEFITELSRRADCGILLDVNNVFVSATNHGFDPREFINGLPVERVGQMHLGGYTDADGFFIDTHDHPVSNPVWDLYGEAVRRFGAVPTLIEWDDKIPAFEVLEEEARKANVIREAVLGRQELTASR
jgi:uncharacterized protein (UPF0276 family)